MTVRVPNPKSTGLARISQDIVESGDGAWYPVVGAFTTLGSIVGSTVTTINYGPEFLALLIPALIYLTTIVAYRRGTVELSDNDSKIYRRVIYQHMPKINGTGVEHLADPIVEQIWQHTEDGHAGKTSGYSYDCNLCSEREKVIIELIPKKATNRSDIEAARRYLEMKKEADALHEKALKELMS